MLSIKILSLNWVKAFAEKLAGACKLLEDVITICQTVERLLVFTAAVADDKGVHGDALSRLQLSVDVPSDTMTGEGEPVIHSLHIDQAFLPVSLVLQVLHLLNEGYTRSMQNIEKDSSELQELLGAVSAFKEALCIADFPPACPKREGDPQPN